MSLLTVHTYTNPEYRRRDASPRVTRAEPHLTVKYKVKQVTCCLETLIEKPSRKALSVLAMQNLFVLHRLYFDFNVSNDKKLKTGV